MRRRGWEYVVYLVPYLESLTSCKQHFQQLWIHNLNIPSRYQGKYYLPNYPPYLNITHQFKLVHRTLKFDFILF